MQSVFFVVPGQIETRTGGYIYDRRMIEGLGRMGWSVELRELDATFPFPDETSLDRAAAALAGIRDGAIVVVDGLALSAMPGLAEREASRLQIVALVHLPLSADVTLDSDTAAHFEAAERRALAVSRLVIVTGSTALGMLATRGLPCDKAVIVEPGTDRADLAAGSGGGPLQLLSVATIGPGKGHELLVHALATVTHHDWRLTCAGSVRRHPATVDRLRAVVHRLGLGDRVAIVGELDCQGLDDCYRHADLFVLATLQETYGMAVAEALAHGLPVVSTTTGAIPDLVGNAAGLLVRPGDTQALSEALSRMLGDTELRAACVEGARAVRDRLPGWDEACARMSAALAPLHADE